MSNNRKPRFPDIDDLSPEDAIKSQIDRLTFTNNNKLIVDAVIDFPVDGLALELTQEDIKNQLNKLKFTDDKLDVNIGITTPLATEATLNLIQGKTSNFSYTDNNKLNVFLDTSNLATESTLNLIEGKTSNLSYTDNKLNVFLDTSNLATENTSSKILDCLEYYNLKKLRELGKCFIFSRSSFTNQACLFYLNNPANSGQNYYVYNIMMSLRPGASAQAFVTFKIAFTNMNLSNTTATTLVPLNTGFGSITTTTVCGFNGTPPTGVTLFASVINANAQSIFLDFQEEYIEIVPGTCFFGTYEVLGANATVDVNIRVFFLDV